jgi:hypothetical protein
VFAEQGDNYKAKLFTDALYFLWTAYCFILAVCILFAGYRLLKILRHHLKNQEDRGSATAQKIKHGAFKVKFYALTKRISNNILIHKFFCFM